MPIPFLVVAAAGVIGVGGHLSAKETNEKAQLRSEEAERIYNRAKSSLEQMRNKTEKNLLSLGYKKKEVLENSMKHFLAEYDKIKRIRLKESVGLNELSKFSIDPQGAIEMQKMTDIYSASFASSAVGAATGTVVALAASGALPVVAGELSLAGSALMMGEIGVATGMAGSALSFGAAMTPLAAVAAPVVLFTGISASMKADENLEKANTMYAEAEAAVEKMKVSETLCKGISDRAEMFENLLIKLNRMFSQCTLLLTNVVRTKEIRLGKKQFESTDFSQEELNLIAVTRALAGAVKAVVDTPILSKDGEITTESDKVYRETNEKVVAFNHRVQEVSNVQYDIERKVAKQTSKENVKYETQNVSSDSIPKNTMAIGVKKVLAFVIGIVVATVLSESIAHSISNVEEKFLFMQSYTANKIAVWLVLSATLIMILTQLKSKTSVRICGMAETIGMIILYVQVCRYMETVTHYIIVSIVMLIGIAALYRIIERFKDKINNMKIFETMEVFIFVQFILFLIYKLAYEIIGIPLGLGLVVTTIVYAILSVLAMIVTIDEKQ